MAWTIISSLCGAALFMAVILIGTVIGFISISLVVAMTVAAVLTFTFWLIGYALRPRPARRVQKVRA